MQLMVKDIVKFLDIPERTVFRWIKSGEIPAYKVGEQYRFNRHEIIEWAVSRKLQLSPEIYIDPESEHLPPLSKTLKTGGIYYRVEGNDKESVLRSIVSVLRLPEEIDMDFLHKVLLAREALGSTAIGDGIAIPHPRNPIVLHVPKPIVALCFLEKPIDFGALDSIPVRIVFTLISPTVRTHLHLLSRLAFAIKNEGWRKTLAVPGTRDEIISALERIEAPAQGGAGSHPHHA